MASGRIRRRARRGIALAVLGWLGVAAFSVAAAPSAAADRAVTIEIKNVTPPAAGVDPGGTVTFVNRIPPANQGGISVPLVGSVSATVYTDVAVTFFNQEQKLQLNQSASWAFSAPATTGTITYTYRIVPQAGLSAAVANQVVNTVAAGLPKLPLPTPYVVQTIAPNLPNLPSVNLPPLPQVNVEVPTLPTTPGGQPPVPGTQLPGGTTDQPGPTAPLAPTPGTPYAYDTGAGATRLSPADIAAAAAFDPARFVSPESAGGAQGATAGGAGSAAGGSGGAAGGYDGASVPVFGQLAGLDGAALDEESAATDTASASSAAGQTLPAAALAAVIALAAVSAALVRTHQAARASR
jgi:hypothetical protein